MNATELREAINRRDMAIRDIDPCLPMTLDSLALNRRAQFPTGAVLTRLETLDQSKTDYDVARETWIVRYEYPNGEEWFFKIPVYFNSWDDGSPNDKWDYDGSVTAVRRVPVQTFKWEDE